MVSDFNELDLMQARVKSIPTDWKFMPVSKAFKIRNEFRKPISDDIRSTQQGIYPYYGPTKIQDYIDTYEQDGSFALIGEDGDHFLKYKNLPMTQLVDGKCTVNNHAHIIEATELATREWFYYYFMHKDIFSYLSRQGAGRYKLNKASLEKIGLLVPPIQEQKKIAEILSTWDKAIETVEKLVANSQQQKKALMQQLLTGQKRLLDENGVKFGGEWAKLSFGDFGKCIRGVSYKPEDIVSEENENTIRLLRSTNIQEGSLNDKDLVILPKDKVKSTQILKNTDLAVCMANGSKSLVGKSAPFNHSEKVYTVGAFCAVFRPEKNVSAKFVKFLFESEYYFSQISLILAGSSINNLKGSDIEAITFLAPKNIHEQEKIAQVLTLADREIDLYQQQLNKLKLEKKSLMQQLLTGQKRVTI